MLPQIRPCTCDFWYVRLLRKSDERSHMGKPIPERLHLAQHRVGLDYLTRGPDPRSYNEAKAAVAKTIRAFTGSDRRIGSGSDDTD